MPHPVVILGLGYTTQGLVRRLRAREIPVFAAVRGPERFAAFTELGVKLLPLTAAGFPRSAVLVHSIPPLAEPEKSAIHTLIQEIAPRRIVYISSTGVYGAQSHISEDSPAAPNDEKGHARIEEEDWLTAPEVPWSTLILRSAAIYGPGRGIHVRLREGKRPRGSGGVVSRIHVDDLVAILEAGIDSQVTGEWPIADEQSAPSDEVSAWCANLMGIALPGDTATRFPVSGRDVDGTKIRELLGVKLKYPSYKTGIPATLIDEKKQR